MIVGLVLVGLVAVAGAQGPGDFVPLAVEESKSRIEAIETEERRYAPLIGHHKQAEEFFDNIRIVKNREAEPEDCECGKANEGSKRIINGTEVTPQNKYPWVTLLRIGKNSFCTAFVTSLNTIGTAGHCASALLSIARNDIKAYVGCHYNDENRLTECEDMRDDLEIDIYPLYFGMLTRYKNDVARITFKEPLKCSTKVRPICLPTAGFATESRDAIACGWGSIDAERTKWVPELLETTLQIPTQAECQALDETVDFRRKICAVSDTTMVCAGDSGSALFVREADGKHYAVGIASYTYRNCAKMAVFTKVERFGRFIQEGRFP